MKSWTMFMIAIGFLLITISPTDGKSLSDLSFCGLILVLIGVIKMKKKK